MTQTATIRPEPGSVASAPTVGTTHACPECGQPAEIADRFTLVSTSGPLEHIRLRGAAGGQHLTLLTEGIKP